MPSKFEEMASAPATKGNPSRARARENIEEFHHAASLSGRVIAGRLEERASGCPDARRVMFFWLRSAGAMSGTGILGACQVHHVRKGAIHELHPPHVWIDRILHHANERQPGTVAEGGSGCSQPQGWRDLQGE